MAQQAVVDLVRESAAHGPSELRHIDYLDGWRGLAIALVLQAHFFTLPGFKSGRFGVDVFFVLSGFLMSRILFVKRVPLAIFYKRRISRILPAFLLYVAVVYGAAYALNRTKKDNVLWTITFLRTYLPANSDAFNADIPISQLWSLNVEEHCYVFLSLVTLIVPLRGREGPFLLLAGTASVAIHFAYCAYPNFALFPQSADRSGLRSSPPLCRILPQCAARRPVCPAVDAFGGDRGGRDVLHAFCPLVVADHPLAVSVGLRGESSLRNSAMAAIGACLAVNAIAGRLVVFDLSVARSFRLARLFWA